MPAPSSAQYLAPHVTPCLTPPTKVARSSYLEAAAEYRREGGYPDFDDLDLATLAEPAAFAAYVEALRADPRTGAARTVAPPMTLWWWVAGCRYLGRISIWHRLDADLVTTGHVGYDVRPGARGRGHATAMLAAALPHAHALGIDPAIITTRIGNLPSRAVITANSGRLVDRRGDRLCFEIPTCPENP